MSVRHALLALLAEGPKYGLQLREEFVERTGEVWPLNVGQVYTTLQRLERDGLVESDDAAEPGPQKGFRITGGGEEELTGWLRTPPDLAAPPRDGPAACRSSPGAAAPPPAGSGSSRASPAPRRSRTPASAAATRPPDG